MSPAVTDATKLAGRGSEDITEFHSDPIQCQISRHRSTEPLSLPDDPPTPAPNAHLVPRCHEEDWESSSQNREAAPSCSATYQRGPQANPTLSEPRSAYLSYGDITDKHGGCAKVCNPKLSNTVKARGWYLLVPSSYLRKTAN